MMTIPCVDLSREPDTLRARILNRIADISKKGEYILGSEVSAFEEAFARYLGVNHCVGVASGTDAILLSLLALGIGRGDEVIVPAMTFIATVAPLVHLGITPVLVDIAADVPTIDVDAIEKAITPKTKAIMPVHLHGHPADMETILQIAKRYKLSVIEDACQAHGSEVKLKAGAIGDVGCFSFYPSKNLGAWGDGGAVVTNDESLAAAIRLLRDHGQREKYVHTVMGYNSRLDAIQAMVLQAKLPLLDQWNTKRRVIAALYNRLLRDLPVRLPIERQGVQTNYHVYQIRTKRRGDLHAYLKRQGIHTSYHYPIPLHLQPALRLRSGQALPFLGYKKGSFPQAERFADETLSLPMFPFLTEKEVQVVARSMHRFYGV